MIANRPSIRPSAALLAAFLAVACCLLAGAGGAAALTPQQAVQTAVASGEPAAAPVRAGVPTATEPVSTAVEQAGPVVQPAMDAVERAGAAAQPAADTPPQRSERAVAASGAQTAPDATTRAGTGPREPAASRPGPRRAAASSEKARAKPAPGAERLPVTGAHQRGPAAGFPVHAAEPGAGSVARGLSLPAGGLQDPASAGSVSGFLFFAAGLLTALLLTGAAGLRGRIRTPVADGLLPPFAFPVERPG